MSLILPKGILVNSPGIENRIESINQEPLEPKDIARFWKVYTTTQRRLLDPTAERLENYWWRIWGSRKRNLQAVTVARLFVQISDGETFVPLRGPPNRDESGPTPRSTSRQRPGASSSTTQQQTSTTRRSTPSSSAVSKGPVPPPHPILKKSRGPSSSGPRPTARFISPHESQDEPEPSSSHDSRYHGEGEASSSQSLAPPERKRHGSKSNKKKGQVFVASTSASKRRPVLMRRQSSQNSHSSNEGSVRAPETALFDDDLSSEGQSPADVPKSPESARGRGKQAASRAPQASSSSSRLSGVAGPSFKKHGPSVDAASQQKFPTRNTQAVQPIEGEGWVEVSHNDSQLEPSGSEPLPGYNPNTSRSQAREHAPSQGTVSQGSRVRDDAMKGELQHDTKLASNNLHGAGVRHPQRQMSDGDRSLHNMNGNRFPIRETKSAVSLPSAPTVATEQNELDHPTGQPEREETNTGRKGKERELEPPLQTEMFAKRAVPPVSNKSTTTAQFSGPLTKSKSQLTLLLEEDRARSGKHGSGTTGNGHR